MQKTAEPQKTIQASEKAVVTISFTENGEQLLTGGAEGVLRWWGLNDGREVGNAIQTGSKVNVAAISPDHKWLVCGLDSGIRVWNAGTRAKVFDKTNDHGGVLAVSVSHNSTKFASGGLDKRVLIRSLPAGKRLVGPLQHRATVVSVQFSPSGDRLATATENTSIRIFDSSDGRQLLDIPFPFMQGVSSPFAWFNDGRLLIAVKADEARCFDTSSGTLLGTWTGFPGHGSGQKPAPSIAISSNQNFIAITTDSLSFWDVSTRKQIGHAFQHENKCYSPVLCPGDNYIAVGENNGTVTMRNLRDILPESYFRRDLPLMSIDSIMFEAWARGNLNDVEEALTGEVQHPSNPSFHAQALAHRALIRSRSKQYNLAVDDAKKSLEIQWSTIGQVAIAIARAGSGELDTALRVFDLVFSKDSSAESDLLLLIKAIILFECGKHGEAVSRVKDLIDVVVDKSIHLTIQAQMYLLLADMSLDKGDYDRAVEFLQFVREIDPPQKSPQLTVISLIFGWTFDGLPVAIQTRIHHCAKELEGLGDAALLSKSSEDAAARYTTVLSLNPPNLAGLLVKRSEARAMSMSWDDALKDADAVIKADPKNPWGYERRYVALDGLQRYDDAVDALNCMLSLVEDTYDPDAHWHQYGGDAAFGKLLEDIMARLGEEKVLAWTGKPSSYNSCIPADFSVCRQACSSFPSIEGAEMDSHMAALRTLVSSSDALLIRDRVIHLPPIRLANRRLFLPCIVFQVKKLVEKEADDAKEKSYRARVAGIGQVEFKTSDNLSLTEPRKLVFAYPWIFNLRPAPAENSGWGSASDSDESDSDVETETNSGPAVVILEDVFDNAPADDDTCALEIIVRLQQPFRALLLQQQPGGEFERVATEHEIVVPGLERRVHSAKDIRTEVLEIW